MVKQTHLVQSENLWEKEAAMPNSWVDINVDGQTMEGYLTQPETEGRTSSTCIRAAAMVFTVTAEPATVRKQQ